jgi:hypothetical protein
MQFAISEQAARVFSEELYRAVADGLPVDAAVSEARRAVSHAVSGIEWATPVLFMRAPDGRLFDVRQAAAESPARRVSWWRAGVALGVAVVAVALAVLIYLLVTDDEPDGPTVPDVDITIDEIDVIPSRPIPGERVAVIVKISNTGEREIGPFAYEFREDVLDSAPSVAGEIEGLGPGSTETVFIPFYYSWWGAFVSELRVDVTSAVPETDEFNNILRNPVVTSSSPLVLNLAAMPNGMAFDESTPLAESVFAPWGLTWEAVPPDAPGCEDVVPWIIVEAGGVFMSTGKPDDPAQCTDGGLIVSPERGPVGGVGVTFEVEQASEYTLVALDEQGVEVDLVSEAFEPGDDGMLPASLEIGSSLASRLEIAQAALPRADGARTRIAEIKLYESSDRMGVFR